MDQQTERFYELVEKSLEEKLQQKELQELENLLNQDPEFKELFFQLRHQHAALSLDSRIAGPQTPEFIKDHFRDQNVKTSKPSNFSYAMTFAATLLFGLAGIFLWSANKHTQTNYHAVLEKTEACIWLGGSLPTLEGSELQPGVLNLDRGFASLRFNSGASLKLEGPAKIKIIDDMNCELIHGNLVADVPESAHKFSIKTQRAQIIDLGTSFSLNVKENGDAHVNVIKGEVIAKVHHDHKQHHLNTGEGAKILEGGTTLTTDLQMGEIDNSLDQDSKSMYDFKLRTDEGKGDDTYVYSEDHPNKSNTLLLIKNGALSKSNFQRHAFVRFDLNLLPQGKINKATLQLEFLPTGFGSGLELSDSEFSVYAIIDDQHDQWGYPSTTYENASIHIDRKLNFDALKKLGSFVVPRGKDKGIYQLHSDLLKEALITDQNRLLSLVIVRDTAGNSSHHDTLVHGVASRRHPVAQPPTLKISFSATPQI